MCAWLGHSPQSGTSPVLLLSHSPSGSRRYSNLVHSTFASQKKAALETSESTTRWGCLPSLPPWWEVPPSAPMGAVGPLRHRGLCYSEWGGVWCCASCGEGPEEGALSHGDWRSTELTMGSDLEKITVHPSPGGGGSYTEIPLPWGSKCNLRSKKGGQWGNRAAATPPNLPPGSPSPDPGGSGTRAFAVGAQSHGQCQEILLQNIFFFLIWKDKLLAF